MQSRVPVVDPTKTPLGIEKGGFLAMENIGFDTL